MTDSTAPEPADADAVTAEPTAPTPALLARRLREWLSRIPDRLPPWARRALDRIRALAARLLRFGRRRGVRRVGLGALMLVVTLLGITAGLALGGHTRQNVGPFSAEFSITPSLSGGTSVHIPPLGSLDLDSHDGPAHLSVQLDQLDQGRAVAAARDPAGLQGLSAQAVSDAQHGVRRLIINAVVASLIGVAVLSALVFRNWRRVAGCLGLAVLVLAGSGLLVVGTLRPKSVEEPKYQGLLVNAPSIIGDAKTLGSRYETYQAQLSRLFANVTKLYSTFNELPTYAADPTAIRVLHVSDLHLNPQAWPLIQTMVEQFKINFVVDTGDMNDWGTVAETGYANSIGTLGVPYVFVQGNHDSAVTAAAVAAQPNAIVLADDIRVVKGMRVAGIGDPLFTPDKSAGETTREQSDVLTDTGTRLADTIRASGRAVDLALVHEPAMAGPLAGVSPLVLAGHLHKRQFGFLANPTGGDPTCVMVEGSTGAAGLRGLEHEEPTPLELSVLYFDGTSHKLQAYDDVTVGGTGRTDVTLQRHVFAYPKVAPSPTGSPTPTPSGTGSPEPSTEPQLSPTGSPTATPS
jgi:predicted MPP superfamily phosphohydrolase